MNHLREFLFLDMEDEATSPFTDTGPLDRPDTRAIAYGLDDERAEALSSLFVGGSAGEVPDERLIPEEEASLAERALNDRITQLIGISVLDECHLVAPHSRESNASIVRRAMRKIRALLDSGSDD
jgi:hypothetical protein